MRYKFIYKIDGEVVFQGLLKEMKCKKHDCPNKVSIGLPYCPEHRKTEMKLDIKPSTLPELSNQPNNDGLFAYSTQKRKKSPVFYQDAEICFYDGEILTDAELRERYHGYLMPYALELSEPQDIQMDCALQRSLMSMANHCFDANKINAVMEIKRKAGRHNAVLKAIKPIYHDEEILISYGDDYWAKHEQQAQRISYETVEANTAIKTVAQTLGIKTAKKNTGIKTTKRKKKVITVYDSDDSSDLFSSSE